jgi:hypothetical protein
VLAAAAVGAGAVVLPALSGRDRRLTARHDAQGAPAFSAAPRSTLDLAAYPARDVVDDFTDAPPSRYERHRPERDERLPKVAVTDGRFIAAGRSPYYGWFVPPGEPPSSDDTVSILTLGPFAGTGADQDTVFVGRIKDAGNYVGIWFSNTSKEIGTDLRVNSELVIWGGGVKQPLQPGDQLALVVSGDGTISAYVRTGGTWALVKTVSAALPGSPEERRRWRHGFAVRGSTGTISVDAFEGRSR